MTKKKRGVLVLLGVLGVLAVAEVGINLWRGPTAYVEIENLGAEPIEDLAVTWRSDRVEQARVEPGATTRVLLSGRGAAPLVLRFHQRGNALGLYELPGFDPATLHNEGSKQVLRIRTNEVERFLDEGEPSPLGRLTRWLWRTMEESVDNTPTAR